MAGQVVDVGAPWAGGATPIRVDVACGPIIFRFEVAFRPDFALGRKFFDFRRDFALGRNKGEIRAKIEKLWDLEKNSIFFWSILQFIYLKFRNIHYLRIAHGQRTLG